MSQSPDAGQPPITYRDSGVDIDAGNALVAAIKPMVRSTRRSGAEAELGGFGGLFDLKSAGYRDPILVAANDGVGTKLKVAIESGQHDAIGVDLVAMCVNDLVVQGAEPLFFLDYFSTGKLDLAVAERVIAGIVQGCREAGCALIGGETAEMPGMYQGNDYDLAGFAVGAAERGFLLPSDNIALGDCVIGLPSSGPHANGFSLIRRLVAAQGLAWDEPAPFAPETALATALLTPTRIYVKTLLAAIKATGGPGRPIKALAHVTGGGMTENLPRVLPADMAVRIELGELAPSPVFGWLQRTGHLDDAEMLRTFNCGIGMLIVAAADACRDVMTTLSELGETPLLIGEVIVPGSGSRSGAKGKGESWAVEYAGRLQSNP